MDPQIGTRVKDGVISSEKELHKLHEHTETLSNQMKIQQNCLSIADNKNNPSSTSSENTSFGEAKNRLFIPTESSAGILLSKRQLNASISHDKRSLPKLNDPLNISHHYDDPEEDWKNKPIEIWDYERNCPFVLQGSEPTTRDYVKIENDASLESINKDELKLISTKRGPVGLASFPHRLDTLERVLRDSELRRVFSGKYGKIYQFVPFAAKTTGIAIGTLFKKKHTCSSKGKSLCKKWLGKVGEYEKSRYGSKFSRILNDVEKNERYYNVSVILEYVANCLYRVFSDGSFETPKNRLSKLDVIDEFTKDSLWAKQMIRKMGVTKSLRVMSKWCEDYKDLASLKVKRNDDEIVGFREFVEKEKSLPAKVIEPSSKKEVKIEGLLGLLSAATSIGDPDSLGGGCNNAGYIVNKDKYGEVISIRIVKVDPGFSFSFKEIRDSECGLSDPRDIRYGNNAFFGIGWRNLSDEQRYEFLEVKLHHLEIIKDRRILEYVFLRSGDFNRGITIKMPEEKTRELITQTISHVQKEGELYKEDLKEYVHRRLEILQSLAREKEKDGEYDRALCETEKVLKILLSMKCEQKEKRPRIVDVFSDLSRLERFRGRLDRSFFYCEKQLSELQQKKSKDINQWNEYYHNLAYSYYEQGDYNSAIKFYRKEFDNKMKSMDSNRVISEHETLDICSSLNNIGLTYLKLGEHEKSIEHIRKSVEIQLKVASENHRLLASSYNNLGIVYFENGDYDLSIESHGKGLAIQKKLLPENHPKIAVSFNNLGNVYQKKGEYDLSIQNFRESLKIQLKKLPENHPDIAMTYNNLGIAYENIGEYDLSIENHRKGLDIKKESLPDNHPDLALSYHNLGTAFCEKGEYDLSIENLSKSLEIRLKSLPDNQRDIASSYTNLGVVYGDIRNYDQSFENFKKAHEIVLNSYPENHPGVASSYNNLGNVYSDMEKFDLSLENHRKSLEIRLKSLPKNHRDIAASYHNLGAVYDDKGEYDLSIENYQKGLEIRLISLPKNHPEIAASYNNWGSTFMEMGKYEESLKFLQKALTICDSSENHPITETTHFNLGLLFLYHLYNYEKAVEHFSTSYKIRCGLYGSDHTFSLECFEEMKKAKDQAELLKQRQKLILKYVTENKCTFEVTGEGFFCMQKWFECKTCGLENGDGFCEPCMKTCHVGHDVVELSSRMCFCDCGAENEKCKLITDSFRKLKCVQTQNK